jgi:hypothetical protein
MTTLRRKMLVVVSAIVVTLAFVVLPGCKKTGTTSTQKTKTPAGKDVTKGME